MAAVVFGLGRIAIINAERRDAEKKRGDTLQQSIDALRDRSEEDRKFFEIVRQLLIAQGQEQRNALLDQLRGFKFSQPMTTTTTESRTTTTTRFSSVTTAPRSPSTTTTTRPSSTTTTTQHSSPPPSSPPPTKPCTTVPVVGVCSPAPNNN